MTDALDPESLGFSRDGLVRITSWYQTQIDLGVLSGAVIAVERNGKLVCMEALGY
jgi:hypothetical protein